MGKAIIEYAGYRAPRTTNWDKVLGEVGEDITGVVTKREKQREEDFNIQQETESAINDFTTGVSQDFSDYVSRGVEANRDVMMKYTKMLRNNQINSTQYKRLMNRVNSDWQQFGQFSKDFETRLADMETRRKNGDSSVIETWNGERIASAADFKNKQLVPNASSGGLYSVSYGADGKPKKTEIIHMNELNNFRGQLVDKVNLQDQIKTITSKAGDFRSVIGKAPIKTAEGISQKLAEIDPKMATEYNNLIDGVYNSVLTGPPNRVASALADNSLNSKGQEYFIYKEGDLNKGGKFEGRDPENGIKMVQETDGSWGGELTEKQRELLKKKSKEIADVQLGFKEAYMAEERDFLEETKIKAAADIKKARIAASAKSKGKGFGETEEDQIKIYRNTNAVATGKEVSLLDGQKFGGSTISNSRVSGDGRFIYFDKIGSDGKVIEGADGQGQIEIVGEDGESKNRTQIGKILFSKQNAFDVQEAYNKGKKLVPVEDREEIEKVEPGEFNKLDQFYGEETEDNKSKRTELGNIMVNTFRTKDDTETKGDEQVFKKSDPRFSYLKGLIDDLGYTDINIDDLEIVVTTDPGPLSEGTQKLRYKGIETEDFVLDPNDSLETGDSELNDVISKISDFLYKAQTEGGKNTTTINMG
jgi:hypothetical protein